MAKRFCVMTVGRSGSTSLMEALEKFDDIAVPAKNIECEDNELVHPKRVAGHIKLYADLCKKKISNQDELIEAFFDHNKDSAYAGFKSMPNRHNAKETFLAGGNTRIITLRRQDIASTSASFLRAEDAGTWRRHGEKNDNPDPMWTFDPKRDAVRARKNVAYIFQSHRQLASFPNAIHLTYEDLCNPQYSNAELDKFFGRDIRLENPKPPTSGSTYVSNWEEFSKFVNTTWQGLLASLKTQKGTTITNAQAGTVTANAQAAPQRRRVRRKAANSKRVFYAWELGMDLGHLLRFLAPALRLRDRGYEVCFAVRDLSNAESTLGRHGFTIMQAPIWIANVGDLPKMTISYAEIALRYGFISYPGLKAMTKAWRELFNYVKPGLVLTDHSPSALLAVRTMGLKCAPIGSGFFNPPMTRPLPSMRYWNDIPAQRIERPDTLATQAANMVIADMGGKKIQSFCDLFDTTDQFLCTFKELDHYPNRGQATYWGPTFEMDQGAELKWPKGEGKRIFAYIKPRYRDFEKLLEALQGCGSRVLAYTPGITKQLFDKYNSDRLVLSREPLKLRAIIKDCDMVVCHGGPGTVTASLLAGVPLILLPTQLEQFMSTRRVVETGSAIMVVQADKQKKGEDPDAEISKQGAAADANQEKGKGKKINPSDAESAATHPNVYVSRGSDEVKYPELIQRALKESAFRDKAREFAKKYSRFSQAHQASSIANRVEELLQL